MINFDLKVVWIDELEWRICLPDGRYILFTSINDLRDKHKSLINLIEAGIESSGISILEWLKQNNINQKAGGRSGSSEVS